MKLDLNAKLADMERVDFASFVYANARAVAELARAGERSPLADRVRCHRRPHPQRGVLQHLWDDETQFFYPQRAADDARIPIRELHGFFPFTTLLAPDEPRYTRRSKKFVDPEEFWARSRRSSPASTTTGAGTGRWTG